MTSKHLHDHEIQQYVLHKKEGDIDVDKHIQHCRTCKIKAEEYNLLFEGIKQQEKPVFNFDLADSVIEQLPTSGYKVSNDKSFSYFIFFIPLFSLYIIFYLLRDSLLSPFNGTAPILVALIVTTVLCLFVILCIDMYRKYQMQMKTLNFY